MIKETELTSKVDVRLAQNSDAECLVKIIKEFYEEGLSGCGVTFSDEKTQETFFLNEANTLVVTIDEKIVGFVGGTMITFPISNVKVFQEIGWYIQENYRRYGVLLFRKLEEFCRKEGVKHIVMGHLAKLGAERLAKFFKRMGYKELEVHYIKEL